MSHAPWLAFEADGEGRRYSAGFANSPVSGVVARNTWERRPYYFSDEVLRWLEPLINATITGMSRYIKIRKQGASLYLPLPYEFVRANDLKPGDFVLLEPEKLKIARQSTIETVAEPAVVSGETVEAAK